VTFNNYGHEFFAVSVIGLTRTEPSWWKFCTFTFCSLISSCRLTVSTLYSSCYFSSHCQVLAIHVQSVAPVFCASQIRCYVLRNSIRLYQHFLDIIQCLNYTFDRVTLHDVSKVCSTPFSGECILLYRHISIVGYEVLTAVAMKSSVFWNITPCIRWKSVTFRRNILPPSSGSKNTPSQEELWRSKLVSFLGLASALKMEALYSSEISIDLYWTTWHYILEDKTIQISVSYILLVLAVKA
jgi:hypothetical protein